MICPVCKHGNTASGTATVTLERDGVTLVFKNVPAMVCDNCGEEYLDEDVTVRLLETAEEAAATGVLVDVRRYNAA